MRTILCTVGTSIAAGCSPLRELQLSPKGWDESADELKSAVSERLSGFDLVQSADRIAASAELNSLHRLSVAPEDTVVLFATDTADGRVCAEQNAACLRRYFGLQESNVVVERIEGLEVHNSQRLRTEGLTNLVSTALKYLDDVQIRYSSSLVINPTGGYKGVVPFFTVLGMLFHAEIVYVFEFSESLVTLPPLPISFDLALFSRAMPGLDLLVREGAVSAEQYFSVIGDVEVHERELLLTYVEQDGDLVTLSPLAFCLHKLESSGAQSLKLSPEVAQMLRKSTGNARLLMDRMLTQLSRPLWRVVHRHRFNGTDLEVYKPGNVGHRAAAISTPNSVYVCKLYLNHDEYERDLFGVNRSDFDLDSFESWQPDNALDQIEQEIESTQEAMIHALEQKKNELKGQLRDVQAEHKQKIREERQLIGSLRARIGQLESSEGEFAAQLQSLEGYLNAAHVKVNLFAVLSESLLEGVERFGEQLAGRTSMASFYARGFLSHITLYLAHYPGVELQALRVGLENLSRTCSSVDVDVKGLWMSPSRWLFLNVRSADGTSLQNLSDTVVDRFSALRDPAASAPSWLADAPEKLELFQKYGSPNVYAGFDPHLTQLAEADASSELDRFVESWDQESSIAEGRLVGLGMAPADQYGQLIASEAEIFRFSDG